MSARFHSLCFIAILAFQLTAKGQDAVADTTEVNNKRLVLVAASQSVAIGGTLYALNRAWYKNYEKSKFHVKDDMGVWLQVDKLGHAYSGYSLAGPLTGMYRWAGVGRKKSALYGTAGSLAVLTAIECMDAYSAEWGFSYGDMGANVLGAGLFLGQELLLKNQVVQLKFSSHKNKYYGEFEYITGHIYGTSLPEKILKDYNAQSYWLSVGVHSFYHKWPKWLNVAVGYGGEDMYGAYYNTWKDEKNKYHDRSDIKRYRQYFLSLDVNLAAINTRYALLNAFFDYLTIKIPSPTLEYTSKGTFKFHALYF